MQKIRTYLVQIKNVFAFLDGLGRMMYRTFAVVAIAAILVTMVSIVSEANKNVGKKEASKTGVTVENGETAQIIEVDMFNVSMPEASTDVVEQTTIVEDLFLSADARHESVEIELSGVTSVEPEAEISQVVTDTVASPVYTSKVGNYTEADLIALQKIVQSEAGICDITGKILVANVVINRVKDDRFPDTIEEVILQPVQFSPVADGNYAKAVPTAETIEAVERALNGEDYSQGALFFASTACVESGGCWAAKVMRRLFEHDGHVFFAP